MFCRLPTSSRFLHHFKVFCSRCKASYDQEVIHLWFVQFCECFMLIADVCWVHCDVPWLNLLYFTRFVVSMCSYDFLAVPVTLERTFALVDCRCIWSLSDLGLRKIIAQRLNNTLNTFKNDRKIHFLKNKIANLWG